MHIIELKNLRVEYRTPSGPDGKKVAVKDLNLQASRRGSFWLSRPQWRRQNHDHECAARVCACHQRRRVSLWCRCSRAHRTSAHWISPGTDLLLQVSHCRGDSCDSMQRFLEFRGRRRTDGLISAETGGIGSAAIGPSRPIPKACNSASAWRRR